MIILPEGDEGEKMSCQTRVMSVCIGEETCEAGGEEVGGNKRTLRDVQNAPIVKPQDSRNLHSQFLSHYYAEPFIQPNTAYFFLISLQMLTAMVGLFQIVTASSATTAC